jgi:antitoxin PrlF
VDKATVTGKGQVTLPRRIRERLGIETGDKLLFDIEEGELRVRVLHGRGISSLFESLPGVETYAGEEAERRAVWEGFGGAER